MSKNNQNAAEMQQEQEENIPQVQQEENIPQVQQEEKIQKVQQEADPFKKLVKIKLPRVKGQRDDVMVGINGKFWQIKRGVNVDVPRPVYEVLQNQEEMELQAAQLEEQLEEQADKM